MQGTLHNLHCIALQDTKKLIKLGQLQRAIPPSLIIGSGREKIQTYFFLYFRGWLDPKNYQQNFKETTKKTYP